MSGNPYPQYPGQPASRPGQPPYPGSPAHSGYADPRNERFSPAQVNAGYYTPPTALPQVPYQSSYPQPQNASPLYGHGQQYGVTPPTVPQHPNQQRYGSSPQQPPYGQQQPPGYQTPSSYQQTAGPAYGTPGQPGQYPPQQQGYPPPAGQQYGGYPPQGRPQHGGYPPQQAANPQQTAAYKQLLQSVVAEKNLQAMYPPNSPILDQIAGKVTTQVDQLCAAWRVPREVGQDIVQLSLFDIILYIDDSGSMRFEENGERIKDLKLIISRVAYAASLFDQDGITVRFMNQDLDPDPRAPPERSGNNITSEAQVEQMIANTQFKGLTPMGTSLKNKVLEPFVVQKARAGQLTKPVLVITVTDGQPAGEPQGAVFEAIRYASTELGRNPRYGPGAISFQFAQVGNDLQAREFLSKLDNEPGIGNIVDCTSNFEVEQDEMSRAVPPVDLTPELWLLKLLLGAVNSSYDTKDEKGSRPSGAQQYGGPPPGQYGGYGPPPPGQSPYPPQGQPPYPPQQGYGAPPQQGYGAPQQGYGRPPQGYSQQPGGYPPPQGGYPPQAGAGYNAPPIPPRY
ncbi:MAG: hypothetical protein M1819_000314 [Sarea resinae]|nr:MAG: hypothetical protein M1819_000314 [Sarea resinae]